MLSLGEQFAGYVRHGLVLCSIEPGSKGPRMKAWNRREQGITDPARAANLKGAGLLHVYSRTCALDIDRLDDACTTLEKYGINLVALLAAPDAVQIVSGRPNRAKLLYRVPDGVDPATLITKKLGSRSSFELRCATRNGLSVQDVLPPSLHPETNKPYAWKYNELISDWQSLPELPAALLTLWCSKIEPSLDTPPVLSAAYSRLHAILDGLGPDAPYDEWLRVGMALHHETDGHEDGLALWDEWSAKGAKYKGIEDLKSHWRSFGNSPNPVTAGSLLREQIASRDDFGDVTADAFGEAEADQHKARVAGINWSDLADLIMRSPPASLIRGILPREELVMIYGQSSAGKSFVAFDMALAVARGISWNGYKVRQGMVGWIAAEAEGSMRNRYLAYCKREEIDPGTLANFKVLGASVDLSNREYVEALAESIASAIPALIVVDTLAAASGGADENSGKDMNRVLDSCRLIHRKTGATVLLVHHAGKDESRGARGWSGLRAAVHAELELKRLDNGIRKLTVTKMRDGTEGAEVGFRLVPIVIGLDEDDESIGSAYVEYVPTGSAQLKLKRPQGKWHRAIREALAEEGPLGDEVLYRAVLGRIAEDERSSYPRKRYRESREQLMALSEVVVASGQYMLMEEPPANPDGGSS